MKKFFLVVLLTLCVLLGGCGDKGVSGSPVAATSSYLAAAVKDILNNGGDVLLLSSPGQCPGHFDITPGQLRQLKQAQVMFRFDFQHRLDRKLSNACENGRIVGVKVPGGMSEIDTYREVVSQVADALVSAGLITKSDADERLKTILARLNELKKQITTRLLSAGLEGMAVITSSHQKDFCQSLGLNVVECFSNRDDPGELAKVVCTAKQKNVRLVVGNVPEGSAAAEKLSEYLKTPMVMLNNFPPAKGEDAFDRMFTDNVNKLMKAVDGAASN